MDNIDTEFNKVNLVFSFIILIIQEYVATVSTATRAT